MSLPPARLPIESTTDELLPSAARTTSGSLVLDRIYNGPLTAMVIEINVSAASGTTPTLDVDLEDSFDGTNWNKAADINASNITAAGRTVKRLNLIDNPVTDKLRLNWTIGGTTPSFTFKVNAYATRQ